ncbi:MAG: hypothetical protein VB962_13105 [Pseudohongiellaceae bacterium]
MINHVESRHVGRAIVDSSLLFPESRRNARCGRVTGKYKAWGSANIKAEMGIYDEEKVEEPR